MAGSGWWWLTRTRAPSTAPPSQHHPPKCDDEVSAPEEPLGLPYLLDSASKTLHLQRRAAGLAGNRKCRHRLILPPAEGPGALQRARSGQTGALRPSPPEGEPPATWPGGRRATAVVTGPCPCREAEGTRVGSGQVACRSRSPPIPPLSTHRSRGRVT